MSESYKMVVESLKINISPYGFLKYSKDFFKAAETIYPEKDFTPVPYFLYSKSIELSLKSFLLTKDDFNKNILKKKYGHNLEKLINKGIEYDLLPILEISEEEKNLLSEITTLYNVTNKSFEYFNATEAAMGYNNFPDLAKVREISKKLLEIEKTIKEYCNKY